MLELKHDLKLAKTRGEKARMNFVSGLRSYVLMDMANGMRAVWVVDVEPITRKRLGRKPKDGPKVHRAISERYERKSIALTANQPFSAWDQVFPEAAMTVAAVDRLVHHSTIFEMNVESYRRKTAATDSSTRTRIEVSKRK